MGGKSHLREGRVVPNDIDPREAARVAQGVGDVAAHLLLLAGAGAAAALRLASYTGPPRPIRVLLLDLTVQAGTGLGVGELALGMGMTPHAAFGLAILSGVVGWELVKRVAEKQAARRTK